MRIIYDNTIKNSSIEASSENTYFKFDTALTDSRLSRIGKTLDIDNQWLKFSYDAPVPISYVVVGGHNISDTATVRIEGNTTDDFTSPAFSQTLTVKPTICENTGTQTYQYYRLFIDDPENADNYIYLSKVFLAQYMQMPPMELGQSIVFKTNSNTAVSTSGQRYVHKSIKFKEVEIRLAKTDQAKKEEYDLFFSIIDLDPFYLLVWENDLDVEPPLYCALDDSPDWMRIKSSEGIFWNFKFNATEVK